MANSEFPPIDIKVSKEQDSSVSVTVSLPQFIRGLYDANASATSLRKATPVPDSVLGILENAVGCCATCHLKGEDMKPVGEGHTANCTGFTLLDSKLDLYQAIQEANDGEVTATMFIEGPKGPDGREFPHVATPCNLRPSPLYVTYSS